MKRSCGERRLGGRDAGAAVGAGGVSVRGRAAGGFEFRGAADAGSSYDVSECRGTRGSRRDMERGETAR